LGEKGGAGNLIMCEVVRMHISEDILTEKGRIDPFKADLVARMGRHYYCRVNKDAIFEIMQPVDKFGMGFDKLPKHIRESKILTGNNLAELAAEITIPSEAECEEVRTDERVMNALAGNAQERENHLHQYAKELLEAREVSKAWKVLML